jgi:amino acid adenylation domain-containing protein
MVMAYDVERNRFSSRRFEKYEVDRSIVERFERQVAEFPDRLAVNSGEQELTYAQLNQLANQVAHLLLSERGGEEEPIALLLEQAPLLIATLLGVLKAGKIYVPFDPTLPLTRLAYLREDSQTALVLTNAKNISLARAVFQPSAVLNLDEIDAGGLATNPGLAIVPETLCYLLYTSGSTGQSKGVPQSHRNVLVDIRRQTQDLQINEHDRFALLFSCSFGASVAPIFGALLNGAALFLLDLQREGLTNCARWLAHKGITICDISVTAFRQLAGTLTGANHFPKLRLISLGGETVSAKDVELYQAHFSSACVLQNALGTTETRTIAQYFIDAHTRLEGDTVPVGYAVEDKEVLLLDEQGREVEPGDIGEIAVKSGYLSPGYWRKPDLTRAAFLPDPRRGSERIYLTGDLGRKQADGCLVHLGRKDSQVKVRGYRVETAEIEMALLSLETVKSAAVLAQADQSGDRRLVAYIVANHLPAVSASTVRADLAKKLPSYMLPSSLVFLDALPLTPNGKVDRRAMSSLSPIRPLLENGFVAARSPIECALANLWEEILQVRPVGIYDDFLDLGGDSLLATRILNAIRQTFHTDVSFPKFFEARTVAELASILLQSQARSRDAEISLTEIEGLPDKESA